MFGNAGLVNDNGKAFNSLAAAVNGNNVDFSVDLGNRLPEGISSSGLETIWNAVDKDHEKFSKPVYPVAGALDIFDYESDLAYSSHYGPGWYSFAHGGITFIVLDTCDDSYRHGFGNGARIGDEQMDWLEKCLMKTGKSPVVLFMNRPLWKDAPRFWRDHLLQILKKGNVSLAVACGEEGLFDWGEIDGIRAFSTGCVGPMQQETPGLFPHAVLVTVDGKKNSFRVISPSGAVSDGIPITMQTMEKFREFAKAITPPVLAASPSWRISESVSMTLANPFDFPLTGKLTFQTYPSTSWSIRPDEIQITVEPKTKKTYYVDIQGTPPDLGPLPDYYLELKAGKTGTLSLDNSLAIKIPRPRTGRPIAISAITANVISCGFDGKPLRIPVSVKEPGTCGRLVIYRRNASEIPVCIHISDLKDLKPGMNDFVWNGRSLEGRQVSPGHLIFMIFVFNKKAPATWVATGPSGLWGTFIVEREISGLVVKTHTDHSLVSYRTGSSFGDPKPENLESFDEILDGMKLDGFAFDGRKRVFLLTQAGIACAVLDGGKTALDASFGEQGYFRFTDYRGRKAGNISFADGELYAGIGGGIGKGPRILIIDCSAGKIITEIDLTEYFGDDPAPPAVTADKSGIYVAHPDGEVVLCLSRRGDSIWKNEAGDQIGDRDSDQRSLVYSIGVDQFGLSYVNAAGTTARCGVIGPDGRGLFQIIPAWLPGLRVSSVFPLIEGKESDGLY
ncbi:MAG: hypothetical protein WCU00_03925, partial [Candidatus Latescibacterota bacterium]